MIMGVDKPGTQRYWDWEWKIMNSLVSYKEGQLIGVLEIFVFYIKIPFVNFCWVLPLADSLIELSMKSTVIFL